MAEEPGQALSRLARAPKLGVVTDLDDTLAPAEDVTTVLEALAARDDTVVVVASDRPPAALEPLFPSTDRITLVAEHGVWLGEKGIWRRFDDTRVESLDALIHDVERVAAAIPGARVIRTSYGFSLHHGDAAPRHRDALLVVVSAMLERALLAEPRLERIDGHDDVAVRVVGVSKRRAVDVARERLGDDGVGVILVLGHDGTDEDMFEALGEADVGVRAGSEDRPSAARFRCDDPEGALEVLRWLERARRGSAPDELPPLLPHERPRRFQLLVVSNRLPELRSSGDTRKRAVGGLVSALSPVLSRIHGVWLGWSGRKSPGARFRRGLSVRGNTAVAWVDLPEKWVKQYYNGYANAVLWPLLHSFHHYMHLSPGDWDAYQAANEAFAESAVSIVEPDAPVWLHDYHLFLVGQALRGRGHQGPIGLFLHVPFCGKDLFFILPQADQILDALLELDLIGFHTQDYADNFLRCAAERPDIEIRGSEIHRWGRVTRVGVFPIGIIPEGFQPASDAESSLEIRNLITDVGDRRLVLGVDRLDYTKGIPERLEAFGRLLTLEPELRGRVCLVQVSVPSRADVPGYAEQRERVEGIVGRVNGEHGDASWVPIRYLYRSYGTDVLAELYRAADVGYVTPLRDGMNLVAKEYVAAQDPAAPGALLLSRFAGAAAELRAALLTNPYDLEGMARDLLRALRMPLEERRRRHAELLRVVSRTTAVTWAQDFLNALYMARPPSTSTVLPSK